MSEQYNQVVASHYAAYRPPFHQMILGRVLSNQEAFANGLDIGCGTGYSAIALTKYCQHVHAIDPSQSMLDRATKHEKVIYLKGAGDSIPLLDSSIDIVTFAGSLFYAKTEATVKELKRVCRSEAIIIPYDFEILLEESLQQWGIDAQKTQSAYDHRINFSDISSFTELMVESERVNLKVAAFEFAHILLSSLQRYRAFADKYCVLDPFPLLVSELKTDAQFLLGANIYYAKYQCTDKRSQKSMSSVVKNTNSR
ncbi:class I SAM-dependent methyltransferase [Tumidithrix elongata RA019]|uniref:Class I SAM-dependent methyltransferase n=1 Tax=Tumidithrix elongata BACA0141 TaxID=2716417 RepID=A0AAW9PT02_9CYAN|nr:class I SAM-dependent methyltransferase [Tumidithrix elongata RA019]